MATERLQAFYEDDYHTHRHKELLENNEYFWARAEASAQLNLRGVSNAAKLLEFGCGIGQNIACVPNAVGFDISKEAREACRERDIPVVDDLTDIPEDHFDVVFCRHVLEHVPYPLDTLREMRRFLKGEGLLILILPKEQHYVPDSFKPDLNQHLYCWNFRTINNLLALAGYRVESNSYQYVVGYHKLLPIRRLFGFNTYYRATLLAGRIFRVGELVIRAAKAV